MKKALCLFVSLLLVLALCSCGEEVPTIAEWTLVTQQSRQLAKGVDYMQLTYEDAEGLPYRLYVLTVDPDKSYLHTGTVDDSYNLMPQRGQNVADQMRCASENGIHAIAAVNGDFFSIKSTYMPSGLCIKDGTVIRENSNYRPFSAFTKDGQYIICDGKLDKVAYDTLSVAVGGSHVIVRNGMPYDLQQDSEFSITSHPRTLSGVKEDGTILFVVIDGRQPKHSNGAPLERCARIMIALGAKDAINHDGGGSSTMILHDTDEYITANTPSDGTLRDVYNSILIVPK